MIQARTALEAFIPEDVPLVDYSQSTLSAMIDKRQAELHVQNADTLNKARIIASCRPHAADFLFAPPIASLGLKLTSSEWNAAVAYKLGLQVFELPIMCGAKGCLRKMDLLGHHAMRCGTEGDRIKRHNQLRNFFYKQCQLAQMQPVLEPPNLFRNCGLRPADWGIPDYRPGVFMAY
ncbi:hypothetical protein M1146_06285, partial [Patescibacteria group bacterium]|nr:hypothetical protein [Patescibacteria group bacterium]